MQCNEKKQNQKIPSYCVANLGNMDVNLGKLFVFALIGKINVK